MERTPRDLLALAVLTCLLTVGQVGTSVAAGFERVLRNPLADPVVMRVGDYWYVTGTDRCIYSGRRLTRHHLRCHELSLDLGEYAEPRPEGIWGLSLYQHIDGGWHAYVTVHFGYYQTAVAHAVPLPGQTWAPGKPIARWKLRTLLVPEEHASESRHGTALQICEGSTILRLGGKWVLVYSVGAFDLRRGPAADGHGRIPT